MTGQRENLERDAPSVHRRETSQNATKLPGREDRFWDRFLPNPILEEHTQIMRKVIVVGAGITGVSTAYALLERGFEVTVVDSHRYAAMETSFANGGQLSVSNAEVWNHTSNLFKGLKWLMKADAPLSINPRPTWHKLSWLTEFVLGIRRYRENTISTVQLGLMARRHMQEIAERENINYDHVKRGILHIYWDKDSFAHAHSVNALLREGGLERVPVTPSEVKTIEPCINGSIYGGFFTESDSTGDIHKYTTELAKVCEKRGVDFLYDSTVRQIRKMGPHLRLTIHTSAQGIEDIHELETHSVVICAGTESRQLAEMVGDRLNIYPVKGYSITAPLDNIDAQTAAPWTSILDDKSKIVTSRLGTHRFRVAGTAELNGLNRDVRHERIAPLIKWTRTLFPDVPTEHVVPWAGLRPMMPDMMPRFGPGRYEGIYYNTGHGHLGWTLSSATSAIVAEKISNDLRK